MVQVYEHGCVVGCLALLCLLYHLGDIMFWVRVRGVPLNWAVARRVPGSARQPMRGAVGE